MKLFQTETLIESFIKNWKAKGVQFEFFNNNDIEKCLGERLPGFLDSLGKFIRSINFNGFSVVLQRNAEMIWYSHHTGRIVLNLVLFDPKNLDNKKKVQELAKKAREVELMMQELKQ